ncbi:Uncharacterised protein [Pandoraea pulmonicola]|uniref:Uncharacterized protein n=2 Tax=Pandoraea pulmonicola TaxID=93221 RepID=A0AAJ4ZB55_PANPU|nr:Uncharacterised protein [Pandoraea pulmonicola]
MVFSGFSGLGYEDPSKLKEEIKEEIGRAVELYGPARLCVAAGATREGIGIAYEVAKSNWPDIVTIGVVSAQARRWGGESEYCDHVIYVDDPGETWEVLDEKGKSYMAYLARNNESNSSTGEFLAFGGGNVTLKELLEVSVSNPKWKVFGDFFPDPDKAAERGGKSTDEVLNPVRAKLLEDISKSKEAPRHEVVILPPPRVKTIFSLASCFNACSPHHASVAPFVGATDNPRHDLCWTGHRI